MPDDVTTPASADPPPPSPLEVVKDLALLFVVLCAGSGLVYLCTLDPKSIPEVRGALCGLITGIVMSHFALRRAPH
jgi:hypothetical protein